MLGVTRVVVLVFAIALAVASCASSGASTADITSDDAASALIDSLNKSMDDAGTPLENSPDPQCVKSASVGGFDCIVEVAVAGHTSRIGYQAQCEADGGQGRFACNFHADGVTPLD
jgi:hypothetical protein